MGRGSGTEHVDVTTEGVQAVGSQVVAAEQAVQMRGCGVMVNKKRCYRPACSSCCSPRTRLE